MSDEIAKHVATGKKVWLERSFPSNPRLNGYVLDASETLVLMHCFHDFMPDGFTVFRIADITNVESGKSERHWDRMLQCEGLLGALEQPPTVNLVSIRAAIASISSQYEGLIVECEDVEDDCEDFYIGIMHSIDDFELTFQHFNGLGEWEDTPSSILLDDISLIQFDAPYIRRFWKYLAGPKPGAEEP